MSQPNAITLFSELALPDTVQRAVEAVGYETPTPIQARTIPPLLAGQDLLGHAPTGTGKTAAFALPILARMNLDAKGVQALVLAPTRELAIQVAEAFAKYAKHMKNLRVLPVYGGQDYTGQIRQLSHGVNVVVGTPGRIMDHMRRGTLKLDNLQTLVLDEADEMLRMGFIDDVEWILEQTPKTRQMALFSATMPAVIKRIAARHLTDPVEITIEGRMTTASTIRQRFWLVSGLHKLDALTRILEAESFDAMLVFVRTRTATVELAEKLAARGFAAAAMNGDMPQKQREQMVDKLKRGQLDILVATDVVARGLDVDRISHVINYDIPYDTEAYVHRIGRTGRAGRTGDAILFVTQRERRLLGAIERATRQTIEPLQLPTVDMVNNKRIADFKQRISDTLASGELAYLQRLAEEFSRDHDIPPERVAAALAKMCLGDQPLLLSGKGQDGERRARKDKKEKRIESSRPQEARKSGRHEPDVVEQDNTGKSRRQELTGEPTKPSKPPRQEPSEQKAKSGKTPRREPVVEQAGSSKQLKQKQVREQDYAGNARAQEPDREQQDSRKPVRQEPDNEQHSVPADTAARKPVVITDTEPGARAQRRRAAEQAAIEMERFRVEVGSEHGVKPENLVGAIANEAGLDSEFIGRIVINDDHSTVELPSGMPKFLLKDLKRVWVCNRKLDMSRASDERALSTGSSVRKTSKAQKTTHKKPRKAEAVVAESHDLATLTVEELERREKKKKERHRNKKSKGKRK